MGFVRKLGEKGQNVLDTLSGKDAEEAAAAAGELQQTAAQGASALFDPFQGLGAQGVEQAGFLTDPQAQFDFLQSNPLFQAAQQQNQLATQTAQEGLFKSAAARGRLSAGDTLQQIQGLGQQSANNLLLSASPLIQQQKQSVGDLLTIGQNVAGSQGNLLTGGAASQAAGLVGGANARAQGLGNILNLAGQIGGSLLAPTPAAPKPTGGVV